MDYQLLHAEYGHYTGQQVNKFIEENELEYKVAVIASHGHTTFHMPAKKMTAQLGDGAAIAAETQLPVYPICGHWMLLLAGREHRSFPLGKNCFE